MRIKFKGTAYLPEYRGLHDGQIMHVRAGEAVEVSETEGTRLLKDFPGVFVPEVVAPPATAQDIPAPPVDRQIKEPAKRKRR